MRIVSKLIIRAVVNKKSPTLPRLTLGETQCKTGEAWIYIKAILEQAKRLKDVLSKSKQKFLFSDLYFLVLFHEFHHALKGQKDRERDADNFAWKCFKSYFKRKPVISRYSWRNLP